MFQRTLILVAISAAFASGIPPPIPPCDPITSELQTALSNVDPLTFPIISDVNYIRDNTRYTFDFFGLIIKGFSHVNCDYFNVSGQPLAILNLKGPNLKFTTSHADIYINFPVPLKANFTSQLHFSTLDLRFKIDSYTPYPFSLCITRDTLQMTFHAEGIVTNVGNSPEVTQELNDHPEAVVEAINRYLPRLANDLTAILNDLLCHTNPLPPFPIPTSTPENRRTSVRARPGLASVGIPDYP
ncbi:uncharacterized protein [Palaemon carinicauda]|uniref:uncharacterized protein n=1 Tax=Palaemon carinicauda TaxID=392227 RepID=UPI0035B63E9D